MRPDEPVDPDVDLTAAPQLFETVPREWDLLAVIAVGGILGAEARYGLSRAIPHRPDQFPWATLLTNIIGSLLIGVLMVVVLEVLPQRRFVRPFLGVGVLGGFTTFSTYDVDVVQLLREHCFGLAVGYVGASLVLGFSAAWLGITSTTALVGQVRR